MYEELDGEILKWMGLHHYGLELWDVYAGVRKTARTPWGSVFEAYELVRRRLYALRKKGLISYLPGQGWVAVQKGGE